MKNFKIGIEICFSNSWHSSFQRFSSPKPRRITELQNVLRSFSFGDLRKFSTIWIWNLIASSCLFSGKRSNILSAKEEIGLDELKQNIKDLFFSGSIETESIIISNSRHKQALIRALENAEEALVRVQRNEYLDLVSIYVMSSLKALNEITGNELEEDLVNKIFGDFCVGK